ncbi:hypothetical protein CRUP_025770 [Coryphaenoides rupestris]|nr:hypothetical protein CRUP_025770 [Coryphaenoides rupestris]
MGNYPWLADSWPTNTTSNLVHNSKESVNCGAGNSKLDPATDRYYNDAGISNYLSQTEKCSLGDSTEGPIYSTIDPTAEDLRGFHLGYGQHATPYASASISPYAALNTEPGHNTQQQQQQLQLQPEEGHWATQAGPSGAQYALPDRCSGRRPLAYVRERVPVADVVKGCGGDDGGAGEGSLHANACSPATSYSHQSTATLTPSPHEESRAPHHDAPHLNQLDPQQLARRRLPCGPVPVPQAPGPPLTQSNPNLSVVPYCQSPAHLHAHSPGGTLEGSDSSPATPVHGRDGHGPGSQKSRVRRSRPRPGAYRRDIQGDLPPPPEPPPDEEDRLRGPCCERTPGGAAASSLEKREHGVYNHQRKGSGPRHADGEDLAGYAGKAAYVSRGHVSGNCSTTGSSSSRGSTGSRGPNSSSSSSTVPAISTTNTSSARKHSEDMR